MAQYQHISDVLDLILPGLNFFDLTTGAPRTSQSVKTDLLIFMDLLDELSLPKLQVQTQNITAHLDDICICYQQVEDIYQQLSQTIPETQLNYISIAWQHDHQSHQHKASIKQYHQSERDYWLNVITPLLGDNAETQINQAFELFNSMVRSSSLIEMVNSQIRPYLNSCKGQIT